MTDTVVVAMGELAETVKVRPAGPGRGAGLRVGAAADGADVVVASASVVGVEDDVDG